MELIFNEDIVKFLAFTFILMMAALGLSLIALTIVSELENPKDTKTGLAKREWILRDDKRQRSELPPDKSVRFMQYNTLADYLCYGGPDNFSKIQDVTIFDWDVRKGILLNSIVSYNPDIIGLEEVDHYHDFFRPQLYNRGYDGLFCPKPKSAPVDIKPSPTHGDGVALFWKRDTFELITRKFVIYTGQNQVAIIAKMLRKSDARVFYVAVTHLKAKKENSAIRLAEAMELLDQIAISAQNEEKMPPVVLLGDLNDGPSNAICDFIRNPTNKSSLFDISKYRDITKGLNGITFQSAQEACERVVSYTISKSNPYTTLKYREKEGMIRHVIDYIWYSDRIRLDAFLYPPECGDWTKFGLPDKLWPSDHISLVADLVFLD